MMVDVKQRMAAVIRAAALATVLLRHAGGTETLQFDVVIAGGSTAAFAAAIASAESGARTALLEPTDWVGGQLTSSGVPAVDEAWHSIASPDSGKPAFNVAEIARHPANITPNFLAALQSVKNPGDCWVSRFCFCPDQFVVDQLHSLQRAAGGNLTVFLNTVVKMVELNDDGTRIVAIETITRRPKPGVLHRGYDRLPSADLADWYSPQPSDRFEKQVRRFAGSSKSGDQTVFLDATEWGEVLVLADAPYLQGIELSDGGPQGDDRCGQATVYCFVQAYRDEPEDEPLADVPMDHLGFGPYRDRPDAWERIWTYRRIRGKGAPSPGDLCLQNWGYSAKLAEGGNDFPFGYLFVSKEDAAAQRDDWRGGIDVDVLAAAERRALAWHRWFKEHAPQDIDPRKIVLDSRALGTGHGLAMLPYIRDTRRSVGLDGYILPLSDLSGTVEQQTGRKFSDRIALGAYPADIHGLANCEIPAYLHANPDTLPFYIPFRALTNSQLDNLLVAGKTMAQSFFANSATRLHPIEWSTGTAAGVAAAYMAKTGKTSRAALESISELQALVRERTPIDWTFPTPPQVP
jgi:hypothetical protein